MEILELLKLGIANLQSLSCGECRAIRFAADPATPPLRVDFKLPIAFHPV
jgi:hypothetical protein